MKKRHIIVPIDFTEEALAGLSTAKNIASKLDADLTLFHALQGTSVESFRPSGDMQSVYEENEENKHFMMELIKKKEMDLEKLAKKYSDSHLPIGTAVRVGEFDDAMEKFLDKRQADLIVMGTSGEISFEEMFSGNHAAVTMRKASIPVLTVKEESWISPGGNMLLLVDLRNYQQKTIRPIRDFAELMDLKVLITHIKQKKDALEDDISGKLEDFAKENNFNNYSVHVIAKGDKLEMVKDLAKAKKVEIVASISEGDTGLIRLFFGSDTEDFINKIEKPIMAISE